MPNVDKSEAKPNPAPAAASLNEDRQLTNDAVRARAHDVGVQAVAEALAEAA